MEQNKKNTTLIVVGSVVAALLVVLIVVLLLFGLGVFDKGRKEVSEPAPVQQAASSVVYVYAKAYDGFLNIRTSPSLYGTPIGRFPNGPVGAVLLERHPNGWIRINYQGIIGWVNGSSNYISYNPTPAYQAPAPAPSPKMYAVAKAYDGFVNIRSYPSASGAILGQLYNGQSALIIGYSGKWLKINHNGTVGWINGTYAYQQAVN